MNCKSLNLLAIAVPLFMLAPAAAFTQTKKDDKKAPQVVVYLLDGSTVYLQLNQTPIEVQTAFGKLKVPTKQIRSIEYGMHLQPAESKLIEQLIEDLFAPLKREREAALAELVARGAKSHRLLVQASNEPNLKKQELENIQFALQEIEKRVPKKMLDRPNEDMVQTDKFTIVGKLQASEMSGKSKFLGDVKIKASEMLSMHWLTGTGRTQVDVDAAAFGSAEGQWKETIVMVNAQNLLTVTAIGKVDLWPQGAGQYVAGPDGISGTVYQQYSGFGPKVDTAGALIGKIGENGQPFYIGSRLSATSAQSGKLYLHIVPSPWNSASQGGYQVTIIRGGAAE